MSRTGQQRLDAIPAAIKRSDEFKERIKNAEGDTVRCADLMAEAIQMQIDSNPLETVGRDGRVTMTMERVTSAHCMIAARAAYLRARSSNH